MPLFDLGVFMKNYLENLNKEQYEAATTIHGDVLILAGPGTGKTHTLVSRTAYMIDQGISPSQILILTFTNKAGMEIAERVQKAIGDDASDILATTFHKFCVLILRRYGKYVGLDNNFVIKDSTDIQCITKICRHDYIQNEKKKDHIIDPKDLPNVATLINLYSEAINNDVSLGETISLNGFVDYMDEIKAIVGLYDDYKREHNLLDFDDLLFYMHRLLKENPAIRQGLSNQYKYIMVDEYQDTNVIQNKIVNLITSGNLAVIGDDNQSIYAFRCANIENILNFDKEHPNCKTITLNQNYRSKQGILDFSNAVLSFAKEGVYKELKGQREGGRPFLVETFNNETEAEFIMRVIKDKVDNGEDLSNTAIMVRNAAQSFALETRLNAEGISYKKMGGKRFLEKEAVKNILAFLTVADKPKDIVSWLHILPNYPGIKEGYSRTISQNISDKGLWVLPNQYKRSKINMYLVECYETIMKLRKMTLQEKLSFLLESYYPEIKHRRIFISDKKDEETKVEEWEDAKKGIEEAKALIQIAEKYSSAQAFLDDLTLDGPNDDENGLIITTIHSAKGLEYETVILMDCIEGITPRCTQFDPENNEELRTFYVAITRAKDNLYLMFPQTYKPVYKPFPEDAYLTHFISKGKILLTVDSIRG